MNKFYNESEEMYLETILILKEEKSAVHAIDISNRMGFSRASVSRAIANLKSKEYIDVLNDDSIVFKEKGYDYALKIYERHKILTDFLISLGIKKEVAEDDACRIEHVVSEETMNVIKNIVQNDGKNED